MDFQWYPGHMTRAKRIMAEDIKLVDLVIELLDARAPLASRNPDIDELSKGKSRLVLLNKSDMADAAVTKLWESYFRERGQHVTQIDSHSRSAVKRAEPIILKACEAKRKKDALRGIKPRPVRTMVLGIPNVGKSTFINSYAKKAAAKTGDRPGVTKGKQWIRLGKDLELLDTPGILWPKFEDSMVGLKLALLGSIRDEILNADDLAMELIGILDERYPGCTEKYYNLPEDMPESEDYGGDTVTNPNAVKLIYIAKAKKLVKSGGVPDLTRAGALLLSDFRSARLGRLSLEAP